MESLEPRLLLTALAGNESFEFQDATGLYGSTEQNIRVTTSGNIFVELIGATLDEQNNLILAHIPGRYTASDLGRAGTDIGGGIGGADGVELIGSTPITDAVNPLGNIDYENEGVDAINLQALASDSTGATYAFNVATVVEEGVDMNGQPTFTDVQIAQLVQLDTTNGDATVIAELHLRADLGLNNTKSILAADFNPIDGLLYFVAATGDNAIDRLFTVDVNAGGRAAIEASIALAGAGTFGEGAGGGVTVHSIVFDQTAPGSATLIALIDRGGGNGAELATVSIANTNNLTNIRQVTVGGESVTEVSAIAIVADNPAAAETYIYAVLNGETDKLLRITRSTGVALALGSLPDPDDNSEPVRGSDIGGMTWNPNLVSPFTGTLGVLLGTDTTSDELVYIDHSFRLPNVNIFGIYITQADAGATISIATVPTEGQKVMQPFVGDIGDLRVSSAIDGDLIVISSPTDTGGVFVGIKTAGINPNVENEDLIPIFRGLLQQEFGARPLNLDDTPSDGSTDLSAGVVVAPSILDFLDPASSVADQLLGLNLDQISQITIARDGRIFVFDSDRSDQTGAAITRDELAEVDPVTGQASSVVSIFQGVDDLVDVLAADFGDLDFDGEEDLYAIYDLAGTQTLGTINLATGEFTTVTALDAGVTGSVKSMAFTPDGRLFVIDSNNVLYELNPASGVIIATVGPITEAGTGTPLNIRSFDITVAGQAFAQDRDNGRLVNLDLDTAIAGGLVVTAIGSLRPTVAGIAYDFAGDRFLAADNFTGSLVLGNEGDSIESSIIMQLKGLSSDTPVHQDLGAFFLGGTLSGQAYFSGSLQRGLIGWAITGETGGQFFGSPDSPGNFVIAHDVHDLFFRGPIGTDVPSGVTTGDPSYYSGFDLVVGGRAGQIVTFDSSLGFFHVLGDPALEGHTGISLVQYEVEKRKGTGESEGSLFEQGLFYHDGGDFFNDSFDTPQYLGTVSPALGDPATVVNLFGSLEGSLRGDFLDYYGLALMAGQTVTVQLISLNPLLPVNIGVFDPDGRLIITDYSNHNPLAVLNQPFQFTADRPGVYRFAIGMPGDGNFNNTVELGESVTTYLGAAPYQLLITDAASEIGMGLGALVARQNIYGSGFDGRQVEVLRGDVGLIRAGNLLHFVGSTGIPNIYVGGSDLRAVVAGQIGQSAEGDGEFGPNITVANGSVGLVQSTAESGGAGGGVLNIESAIVSGSVQVIDAAGKLYLYLEAGAGLGIIRADSLANSSNASIIRLNVDGLGADGILDLIDVTGDFGTLDQGGPQITTGPGGNVRYLRVGGDVYQDLFFGGGTPTRTNYTPGQAATFIDDGGATITLTPVGKKLPGADLPGTGNAPNPNDGSPTNPDPGANPNLANLSIVTYGIRGSGGVVLVHVDVNGSLQVTSSSGGGRTGVEISELWIRGDGRSVGMDAKGQLFLQPNLNTDTNFNTTGITLSITGNTPVDIFSLFAFSTGSGTFVYNTDSNGAPTGGAFTSIRNTTGGELVMMDVGSVGTLFNAGPLGLPRSGTGGYTDTSGSARAVLVANPNAFQSVFFSTLTFPFNQQTTVIHASSFIRIESNQAIGYVAARAAFPGGQETLAGHIGKLIADADKRNIPGVFEGIAGPIFATGDIIYVNIGEGLAPSGSGDLSHAGLYAGSVTGGMQINGVSFGGVVGGHIRLVVNNGAGSDIRGDIIAIGGVDSIVLTNGAIINADIGSYNLEAGREFIVSRVILSTFNIRDASTVRDAFMGNVVIKGKQGGIIGSTFRSANLRNFTVSGFGIFNSTFSVLGDGIIGNVKVNGYGLRGVVFAGGASQGNITVVGKGGNISTATYSRSVRQSETLDANGLPAFSSLFGGFRPSRLDDLHAYLGTDELMPILPLGAGGGTRAGIIEDVYADGSRNLGHVSAYRILSTSGIPELFTRFNFSNFIRGFTVRNTIDGLNITTGQINFFRPGADVSRLNLQVAGRLKDVLIKGSLLGSSLISVTGPNGFINKFTVRGDVVGDIFATVRIVRLIINGDLAGSVTIQGQGLTKGNALTYMRLLGSLFNGSLDISGNVGAILVAKSLGSVGDTLTIGGNLGRLAVGYDKRHHGANMALDLHVAGNAKTIQIYGQADGMMVIDGGLTSLLVQADPMSDPTILNDKLVVNGSAKLIRIVGGGAAADVSVLGTLSRFELVDGDLAGNLTAGGSILLAQITRGDLAAGFNIASALGDIRVLRIVRGDLLGSVNAPNGRIVQLIVTGSDIGDGVNPLAIIAHAIGTLKIDGSILDLVTINVAGLLNNLTVGGSVAADAAITAGSAGAIKVVGDYLADLAVGFRSAGTSMNVGGDLGSAGKSIAIGANTSLVVGGDLAGGTLLSVARNLSAAFGGTVFGDVLVDLTLTRLTAAALNGATVASGLDMGTIAFTGAVLAGLMQAGVSRVAGTNNFDGGKRRMGAISSFKAASVEDSILAAGGDFGMYQVLGGTTGSSVSSGMVLSGLAIDAVRDGVLDLTVAGDRDAARTDVTLFRGDFTTANFGSATLTDSVLSAGVGPGAAGDWSMPDILSSLTGGRSRFGTISGTVGAGSLVIADDGITTNNAVTAGGGVVTPNVAYDVTAGDLATVVPLETLIGAATAGLPLVYMTTGGHTVTVTITGPGTVQVRDEAGVDSDDVIDTVLLVGTTAASKVTITSSTAGAVSINRVLGSDGAALSSLVFNGDLNGVSGDIGMWIDGPVGAFSVRDVGDAMDGRIGGDVGTMTIRNLGGGKLYVGGKVTTLNLTSGSAVSVATLLGSAPTGDITRMATDSAGNTWAFDAVAGTITRVDPDTGAVLEGPYSVTLAGIGQALALTGLDFDGAGNLWATASVVSPNPAVALGTIGTAPVLSGLARNAAGLIVAVDSSSGTDRLVSLNPTTGLATDIGQLRDIFNNTYNGHFLALAFSPDSGTLYGLVSDRDGNGAGAAAVALVKIATTAVGGVVRITSPTSDFLPGVLLDGGGVTDDFVAMTIRDDADPNDNDDIFVVRRTGGQDQLVQLTLAGGAVTQTDLGAIQVGGIDTSLVGMGFSAAGNAAIIGLSNDGLAAQLVSFEIGDPGNATAITTSGGVSTTLDAYAVDITGAVGSRNGWAYDTDDVGGGVLYRSSPTAAPTLGMIDLTTPGSEGVFTTAAVLRESPAVVLGTTVTGLAVDIFDTGHAFVSDSLGRLFAYDLTPGSVGDLVGGAAIGTITRAGTPAGGTAGLVVPTDLEFDDTTGALYALDGTFKSLVMVDKATASAVDLFEPGAVNTDDLVTLAFDPITGALRTFSDVEDSFADFPVLGSVALETGLIATSLGTVNISGGAFAGRLTATGNTIGKVTLPGAGNFTGAISSFTNIGSFIVTGSFSGRLLAGLDIDLLRVTGNFQAGGLVQAGGHLKQVHITGAMRGTLAAQSLGTYRSGLVGDTASLLVTGLASSVTVAGGFAGAARFGSLGAMRVTGQLADTAQVIATGSGSTLRFDGGTAAGSFVYIGTAGTRTSLASLTVGGVHRGTIATHGNVNKSLFGTITSAPGSGSVLIGGSAGSFRVTGHTTDALVSFGVWIGPDWTYNTADDVIFGGFATTVTFSGNFIDSAVVAGVLPGVTAGASGGGVPMDLREYVGNFSAGSVAAIDRAEAGGIVVSGFGRLHVGGLVVSNSPGTGRIAAAAAADRITRITGPRSDQLFTRVYGDPIGAPTVVSVDSPIPTQMRIFFSEEINTQSLVLSVDADNNGSLADLGDTFGSVTLMDTNGNIIDDVTLSYTRSAGRGVLVITRAGGFAGLDVQVQLRGSVVDPIVPSVYDRSGLRSALRDFNQDGVAAIGEDPLGTILDGDGDGVEGGGYAPLVLSVDPPNDFDSDPSFLLPLTVDAGLLRVQLRPDVSDGLDVYAFNGLMGQFFGASVLGGGEAMMGIFILDDQGTVGDPSDDTYELVIRHESNTGDLADLTLFQALELPEDGLYYLVIVSDEDYSLQLALASTEQLLATALGGSVVNGQLFLPNGDVERIASYNNVRNPPKQLVFLNFGGGTATQYVYGSAFNFSAFDASEVSASLAGMEDVLINGNGNDVTGIVDNVMAVFMNTAASHPLGVLNVARISDNSDWAGFTAAANGLFFTTMDPAQAIADGLIDADTPYSTVFLGRSDPFLALVGSNTFGIASQIDLANMDKGDEAAVFTNNVGAYAVGGTLTEVLNHVSTGIANVAAHELGHLLGLNHQPTLGFNFMLLPDDPDNNPITPDDSNQGVALMAYPDVANSIDAPWQLGTLDLTPLEFPIGHIDTQQALLWALL